MIPPLFLNLHPDHLVLDMCAAPGSKTSQIIDLLVRSESLYGSCTAKTTPRESYGGVIANEIDIDRAAMLTHQLTRLGASCVAVTCINAAAFPSFYSRSEQQEEEVSKLDAPDAAIATKRSKLRLQFDRILADVPCSGDGTLRKQPDIWRTWTITGKRGSERKWI